MVFPGPMVETVNGVSVGSVVLLAVKALQD
jgi:hypothetical protein